MKTKPCGSKTTTWPDLAQLLDDIRSPQREDVMNVVAAASDDRLDDISVARIADAVMALYRDHHRD